MSADLLHELLDETTERSPQALAVSAADSTLDYAQLSAASRRVAGWLSEQGVGRGDRVIVVAPNRKATVAVIYACSRIGAVFVLLHEQVRGQGLVHVLADAEPSLLITDDPDVRMLAEEHLVEVGPLTGIAELVESAEPTDITVVDEVRPAPLAVDPICLIYTSGSTGMPKAVVSTHGQLLFAARAIQSRLEYRADDVVYLPLPLAFDYGLYQLFLAVLAGAQVWLAGTDEIGPVLLRNLRRSGATILPAVPSLAENLGRMLQRYGGDLRLRLLTNTGAAMQQHALAVLRAQLPALRVQLMFGLTECKRVSIMPPDEDLRRPGASGLPLPGTEVLVLDEDGAPVPPGTIGELVVRGPHVMAGYWHRPELTAERFRRAESLFPQLHSGDYGWLDSEGFLYFSGRRDDLYKSRGFRVSTTEIEAATCRLPGVESAAVVPPGAERAEPTLFVVGSLEPAELLKHLRLELEPYKVPNRCVRLDRLPLTSNGKTDRTALAALC